jgi:transposase-like protein
MSLLSAPYFHDEAAAFAHVEAIIWPNGPHCFHCGCTDRISAIKPNPEKRVRFGLKKCGECKKQFTVRMGTIFEESKLPLHIWLQAIHLMVSSKKGVSSHQLHRTLEVTYKTAWFLSHRIREAMTAGGLEPFGANGGAVEVDETYFGRKPGAEVQTGGSHKHTIISLIDRDTGRVHSRVVAKFDFDTIGDLFAEALSPKAHLNTDQAMTYKAVGRWYASHVTVNHGKEEYARYENGKMITTNTVEGFFSVFKRGMKGVYQHCSEKHLHRYLAEFDFRYSNRVRLGINDSQRAVIALQGVVGKRLTYRPLCERAEA